jgi:hypothetical protein
MAKIKWPSWDSSVERDSEAEVNIFELESKGNPEDGMPTLEEEKIYVAGFEF